MRRVKRNFGKQHPSAPEELSRFAFLIGKWRFKAEVKLPGGKHFFQGTWVGDYILDGNAIADEYRMLDMSGKLVVLGLNLRAYDARSQNWNIKWLDGLTGTWTDLTPSELGGVRYEGPSIIYVFRELAPMEPAHAYTRVTYTNDSKDHFTWRGEKSSDQNSWSEFMLVECHRGKQ